MRKKNCWEMIVSALEAEEVEYVFGMPGSSKLLYDAMYESKKVRPCARSRTVKAACLWQ